MTRTIQIWTLLLLLLFVGCDSSKTSNQGSSEIVANEVESNLADTIMTFPQNQFQREKIIEFGDSVISYFTTKAGYKIENYETTIDTVVKEDYTKYTIKIRTNTYKTNGLISYDIFTFPTKIEATDFFNDLKTQELIVPFGLNKRPNHILLDSNRVYWHHLEHSYGHRAKELTQIFNTKFNFHPQSTNLDSVSGFTYCRCKNDDVTISGIKGKWNSNFPIQIRNNHPESPYIRSDCNSFISEKVDIILHKDSISINGNSIPIEIISSIKLPDNSLFWKYYFSEIENREFSDEFSKKLKKIEKSQESLTLYEIKLTNHCYISFIRLEKGKVYMVVDNKFYTLTK